MQRIDTFDAAALRTTILTFRDAITSHAARLNGLNVYPVPDGDTGTNMARTLDAVVAELDGATDDSDAMCDAISHGSLMGARGNSGVILSQIIRGLVATVRDDLRDGGGIDADRLAAGLTAAADAAYQAVLKPIEGTILTVARAAADGAQCAAEAGETLVGVLRAAHASGREALDRTPELLPVLKEAGVVDAGGAGYLLLLDAWLNVLADEPIAPPSDLDQPPAAGVAAAGPGAEVRPTGGADQLDVSEQRYEVMYLMTLDDERIDVFKSSWGAIGDSIVVVGGDGLWNCHVHTNDVGAAIEAALDVDGRPSRIRVTDLFEEVDAEHARREATEFGMTTGTGASDGAASGGAAPQRPADTRSTAGLPPVTCAVVAVASGDGLEELLSQLGVQGIVAGGQTMNPSTAELLDLVEHVNADDVVLLPNNTNIIAVAEQVDALTDKTVVVVPTRSVPEALAALVVYDPEASAADNTATMLDAAEGVTTGEITQAVRDAAVDAGQVREGDWIGLVGGEGIVAVAGELADAVTGLLSQLVGDEHELLTVVTGDGATAEATSALRGWLSDHRADLDVEVHRGGQPLYPYLIGIE